MEHGKRSQKNLIKLALGTQENTQKDNATKKRIACITEFHDDFNPYNGNNGNNSITLHALSIILLDSTMHSEKTHI